MIKKSVLLATVVVSLGGCLPYNGYYAPQQPTAGYYPNSYNQAQAQSRYEQTTYEDDLSEIGYNSNATVDNQYAIMAGNSVPVQELQQQTIYQELPENPMYQQQLRTPNAPYYNAQRQQPMPQQSPMGVVGIGSSLDQNQSQNVAVANDRQTPLNRDQNLKLIMPASWRMAHPSIGKGLELANEAERFEFNRVLNTVTVKRPVDVMIGSRPVSVIALQDSGNANSRGFLCKDAYLLQSNRDKVSKMWGKFCRHPNWNEWVLTSW